MRASTLLLSAVSLTFTCTTNATLSIPFELLPAGNHSAVLVSQDDKITTAVNQDQLLAPASTLKVITALATKLQWPTGFQFKTELLKQQDDYAIRFSGDPSFSRDNLTTLLAPLKGKTIKGDIYLDGTHFSGYQRGVGWPWDALGVCYSAPSSAMSLEGNCVEASIRTHKDGTTSTYVPSHQAIKVTTKAKSVSKAVQQQQHCELELISSPDNRYILNGCMLERDKPLPLRFAVQTPSLYISQTIKQIFAQNKTRFKGKIIVGQASHRAVVVKLHQSPPLDELLKTMLQDSNNLYADNLTKQLGADYYNTRGSFNSGTAAIKEILLKQANIDLSNAVLEDGSGLSRNNRLSPKVMMEVLQYLQTHNRELGLIELLPVAGVSGTLKYRPSMRKEPILGQIKGKSGSLFGSYNMVGYSLDKQGQIKHTFVQFVSDYHPLPLQQGVEPAIIQFERAFYGSMVQQ